MICMGANAPCKADLCLSTHGDHLSIPDCSNGSAADYIRRSLLPSFCGQSHTDMHFRHIIVISDTRIDAAGVSEICFDSPQQMHELSKHLKDSINSREIPKDYALFPILKGSSLSSQDVVFIIATDAESLKAAAKAGRLRFNN